jgi:hypothetical protein
MGLQWYDLPLSHWLPGDPAEDKPVYPDEKNIPVLPVQSILFPDLSDQKILMH